MEKRQAASGSVRMLSLCVSLLVSASVFADTIILDPPIARGVIFPEVTFNDSLGSGLAGIGDFNGDGFDDIAMGSAPYLPAHPQTPSSVWLVWGRRDFEPEFALASGEGTVHITTVEPSFGTDVYTAGDVDRDGLADLYIHQLDDVVGDGVWGTRLYLLYGSRDLPPTFDKSEIGQSIRGLILTGDVLPKRTLVNPVAPLADFDGDGFSDLAIGQSTAVGPRNEKGEVVIIYGISSLEGVQDIDTLVDSGGGSRIIGGLFSGTLFGLGDSVASAGDVNQDGLTDLVISDREYRNDTGAVHGRVYLIYGSRSFPAVVRSEEIGSLGVIVESEEDLGYGYVATVFGGGDLDADGFDDFGFGLVESTDAVDRGRIRVVRGGPAIPGFVSFSSLNGGPLGFEVLPTSLNDRKGFGAHAIVTPDEDLDGRAEILAGNGLRVSVMTPASQDEIDFPLHTYKIVGGPPYYFEFGTRLASAGDPNGDGIPDYLLSTPDIFGEQDSGLSAVFLLFGGYETQQLAVNGVSPSTAPVGEAFAATITGTGFQDGVKVFFADIEALAVRMLDPATLLVTAPALGAPGPVEVKVVLPDSREAMLAGGFTVIERSRALDLVDIEGVVTFRAAPSVRIAATPLGDVTGDGVDDYALNVRKGFDRDIGYFVPGGTNWQGVVLDESTAFQAATVHFVNLLGHPPEIFPLMDLDGDRRADYAIAVPYSDYPFMGRKEFAVVFKAYPPGSHIDLADLLAEPDVSVFSSAKPLGYVVRAIGDFDGDGSGDLLTYSNNTAPALGPPELVVIRGPIEPGEKVDLDSAPEGRVLWFFDSSHPEFFIQSITAVGDFDGDGRSDIAFAGSSEADDGFGILLGHSPPNAHTDIVDLEAAGGPIVRLLYSNSPLTWIKTLAAAGDINGDGFADVLLYSIQGEENEGYAGVLLGRPTPSAMVWEEELEASRSFLVLGEDPVELFGHAADVGDIDGDGKLDLIVGSARFNDLWELPTQPGEVRIFHDISGLGGDMARSDVPRPLTLIRGAAPTDRFGDGIQVLGDQDGDGLPELLVEASFSFRQGSHATHTYLIPGASILRATPGGTRFRRGDANSDGEVNIADPIRILGALFLGTEPIACEDRGDTNDDGLLNLTDAIYLLNHLFNGDAAPPAPYPDPGEDPTPDTLSCG